MSTHKTTKNDAGSYEYRDRTIYRTSNRSDAYNPWKIALSNRTFPTLKAAKAWIDNREEEKTREQAVTA